VQAIQSFFLPELSSLDFTEIFSLWEIFRNIFFLKILSIAVKGGLPLSLHIAGARQEKQKPSSSNKRQPRNGNICSAIYCAVIPTYWSWLVYHF